MTRIVTCRSHCRACDSCFTSDNYFDAHRTGSPDDRHCIPPDEVKDFEAVEGECRISRPPTRRQTLIYRDALKVQQARDAFSELKAKPSEAKSA